MTQDHPEALRRILELVPSEHVLLSAALTQGSFDHRAGTLKQFEARWAIETYGPVPDTPGFTSEGEWSDDPVWKGVVRWVATMDDAGKLELGCESADLCEEA